jgi:hypothetical protein
MSDEKPIIDHHSDDAPDDSPSSPSAKHRASELWSSLRTTVSKTTRDFKDTLYKATDEISCYSKPICLQGKHCKQAGDREHMSMFRHLCPYGLNCPSQAYTAHYNEFVHSEMLAEEARLVDPNDNRMKATMTTTTSNSGDGSGGILDFLDDSKNENVKTLKHMINFPPASAVAAFANNTGFGTNTFQRNAPISSLTPMRACYGQQMWNVYFYCQTAQWPQPNEMLTEQEEVFVRAYNSERAGTKTRDAKNGISDDRYVGIGPTNNNNQNDDAANGEEAKNKKSVADKAKDFFDQLFGTIRGKNNHDSGNANNSSDVDNKQSEASPEGHRLASSEGEKAFEEDTSAI